MFGKDALYIEREAERPNGERLEVKSEGSDCFARLCVRVFAGERFF